MNYIDEVANLVHGDPLEKLGEILQPFTEEMGHHGVHLLHKLHDEYGHEIGQRIFDLIDLDHDGSITDTIPDIIDTVADVLGDWFR